MKDIDAEDVGLKTSYGQLPWIQPLFQMQLLQFNSGINQFKIQEIKQDQKLEVDADSDSDSIYKDLDAEDVGAMKPCGWPDAMGSVPTTNATSLMKFWN